MIPGGKRKRIFTVGANSLASLMPSLANMLVAALVIRMFSTAGWGQVAVMQLYMLLAVQFCAWGNKEQLLRAFSMEPASTQTLWFASFINRAVLLVPAMAFAGFVSTDPVAVLWLCVWIMLRYIQQSHEVLMLFNRNFAIGIFSEIAALIVVCTGLILYRGNATLHVVLFIITLSYFVKTIGQVVYFRHYYKGPPRWQSPVALLRRHIPFMLLSFTGLLLQKADLLCFTWYADNERVAGYQVFNSFLNFMQAIPGFIAGPYIAGFYRMHRTARKTLSSRFAGAGILVSVAWMGATWLAMHYLYALDLSWRLFVYGSFYGALTWFYIPSVYLLFKEKKEALVLQISCMAIGSNILACMVLIPLLMMEGAMLGNIISQVLSCILFLYFYKRFKRKDRMKPGMFIKTIAIAAMLLMVVDACRQDAAILLPHDPDYTITLRWNKAYADETRENIETGMLWALSFLGAAMPQGSLHTTLRWEQDKLLADVSKAGFSEPALAAWAVLLKHLKESEEYTTMDGLDVGRFIMLTLNSTNHYYAITGVPQNRETLLRDKHFGSTEAAILESGISKGGRLIMCPDSAKSGVSNLAFIAAECDGNIATGSCNSFEFESTEMMPNGQFRFAVYDLAWRLRMASEAPKTISGKPAKCLWCHEINLMPPFQAKTTVPPYYSPQQFSLIVNNTRSYVENYRAGLKSEVDFTKRQDHTFAELLYISFMEPNAARISIEWKMDLEAVKTVLAGLPTHAHTEFPYLGQQAYNRHDVDSLSPYKPLAVPSSAREYSAYEPDFIH